MESKSASARHRNYSQFGFNCVTPILIGLQMTNASPQSEKPRSSWGKTVWRVAVLVVWTSLLFVTVPKLYTMSQIKGWIPGARKRTYHVTQKLLEKGQYGDFYMVSWTQQDIRQPSNFRTNIPYNRWVKSNIGDPIEIITIGNDPSPYVQDDIFVEPCNFVFDFLLLAAELSGIALVIRAFLREKRKPSYRINAQKEVQ